MRKNKYIAPEYEVINLQPDGRILTTSKVAEDSSSSTGEQWSKKRDNTTTSTSNFGSPLWSDMK